MNPFQDILVFVVVAPGVIFGLFGLLWLLDWVPSERLLSWITGLTFASCTSGVAALVWKITSASSITVTFGNWFAVGDLPFSIGIDGGPAFGSFRGVSGGVIRTDRAVLRDLPSS